MNLGKINTAIFALSFNARAAQRYFRTAAGEGEVLASGDVCASVGDPINMLTAWRQQCGRLDLAVAPLCWRWNTDMLLYGLSAILRSFPRINSDLLVYTLVELAAWVYTFYFQEMLLSLSRAGTRQVVLIQKNIS